jgi:hypothetical protein
MKLNANKLILPPPVTPSDEEPIAAGRRQFAFTLRPLAPHPFPRPVLRVSGEGDRGPVVPELI